MGIDLVDGGEFEESDKSPIADNPKLPSVRFSGLGFSDDFGSGGIAGVIGVGGQDDSSAESGCSGKY